MTKDFSQASLPPEATAATASSRSSPVVYTPPSESSGRSNNFAAPQRRPSPLHLSTNNKTHPSAAEGRTARTATGVLAKTNHNHRQAAKKTHAPSADYDSSNGSISPDDLDLDLDSDADLDMPERPPMHRPTDGRSEVPLLKDERGRPSYDSPGSTRPAFVARRSTFRSRSPDFEAQSATRTKYTYAALFLLLSLVTFVIQTETAVYIQHTLKWNKAYCMLYLTHGSWSLLWPGMVLIQRIRKRKTPWKAFWRRHVYQLRTTAQMVKTQDLHLTSRESHASPVPYMLRTTAFVTTALTIAGASWYIAVDLTSASDLTAIYNCSAFFAYAFSIPLLGDKLRFDKIFSVAVAIVGVLIVAYGDSTTTKHGGKSGGSVGGNPNPEDEEAKNRTLGNLIIGVGSVLYGLYEVLYKRYACPPEGTSAGRGMSFAMTFGSMIGCFTLFVLWIPLPILHITGLEVFELPTGKAAWLLLISTLANATFSGSFLVLISLTSPVLSSVAALLTIFLVAIVDWLRTGEELSRAAVVGGLLIIAAFLLLSWSTYRELEEERKKRVEDEGIISESDD